MFWHSALPLGVIGYAATRGGWRAIDARGQRALAIAASIVAASCIAAALVQVATAGQGHLPPIMQGQHYTSMMAPVVGSVWMLNAAALAVLWLCRLRSVLDVCIMVALCAWLLDIALSAGLNAGRFDLGFYAGRVYGLFASCFVLFVLLLENGVLYARLARALDGERNERRRVQEKTEELRALNASLESRVSLRTAALDASNQRLRGAIEERLDAEEALRRSRAELHELAAVGTTAREQEKMRIARELHDELAQSLAMLIMDLGWLQERVGDGDGAIRAKIEAMRKLLSASVASTRRMASDLRPLVLDDFGLVAGIEWLVEKFSERYGVPCELRIVPRGRRCPGSVCDRRVPHTSGNADERGTPRACPARRRGGLLRRGPNPAGDSRRRLRFRPHRFAQVELVRSRRLAGARLPDRRRPPSRERTGERYVDRAHDSHDGIGERRRRTVRFRTRAGRRLPQRVANPERPPVR
jgi:signal transduction histidine kinase